MKSVCIDGYNIAMPKGSGIATYGRALLNNLGPLGLEGQVLYGPVSAPSSNGLLNEISFADPNGRRHTTKFERYHRTLASGLGRRARRVKVSQDVIWPGGGAARPKAETIWSAVDLFYYALRAFNRRGSVTPVTFEGPAPTAMQWTAALPLYAKGTLNLYTLHDLIPLRLPHATLDDKKAFLSLCQTIARKADHIVVVSETTRRDVVKLLGVDEDRVTNTYQAVDIPDELLERPEVEVINEVQEGLNLDWGNYFLFFGAIEPKKNLGRLIEAYLGSGVRTPLVIVGGRAWLSEQEMGLLEEVRRDGSVMAQQIRQYEFLPFRMLVSLIRGAKATVFPSLYEGFGLPVLESMLLGSPVLTSTGGSLPEVAGEAALSVDPYDTAAISRGIRTLDSDADLRADLAVRGQLQAARFSSAAYQARLTDLYGRLGVL